MDNFKELGFNYSVDCDVDYNSQLKVLLCRYQGMGWYKLLVENKFLNIDERYLIVDFGGENGYTYEDNLNEYKKINENSVYYNLNQLYDKYKETSWIQIVNIKDYDGISIQSVEQIN